MAEECTHNCSSCSENCSSREQPESLLEPLNENSSVKKVIEQLNEDVDFVIDAEKDLLMKTLPYHPFLIKPNNLELQEIFGVTFETEEQIIECK